MKTIHTTIAVLIAAAVIAQQPAETKKTIAVISIDSKGIVHNAETMGYMTRLELEKTGVYSVMDRYEVADVVAKNKIDVNNCFAKTCLVEVGKTLGVDKMLSGSAERFAEKIVITLRLIDVQSGTIEKSNATEYLNLQPEVQKMVEISVKKLLGIQPDQNKVNLLIDYDIPIQSPKTTLRLNGPRMGASYTMGDAAKRLMAPENVGGYNMYPMNFQFGWQLEQQYLSAGNFQALVEEIILIGGLESGRFIPSFTFLNGFRMGKQGWEFGFGPTFRFVKKADGFFDTEGLIGNKDEWHLEREWNTVSHPELADTSGMIIKNPYTIQNQLDSRGIVELSTGLLIAVGRTFKSGYLNIPVNVYVSPRKEGTIVGFSFGFNIQKKRTIE